MFKFKSKFWVLFCLFRSVRGTVRGKRNLVKAGIASFLLDQNIKVYIYTDTDRNIKVYIYIYIYWYRPKHKGMGKTTYVIIFDSPMNTGIVCARDILVFLCEN